MGRGTSGSAGPEDSPPGAQGEGAAVGPGLVDPAAGFGGRAPLGPEPGGGGDAAPGRGVVEAGGADGAGDGDAAGSVRPGVDRVASGPKSEAPNGG